MAKKLKSNLYEQWKQEQQQERSTSEAGSRSPSPTNSSSDNDHLERSKELASTASLEAAQKGHDFTHNGGKWCFVSQIRFYGHRLRSKIGRTLDYCRNFFCMILFLHVVHFGMFVDSHQCLRTRL